MGQHRKGGQKTMQRTAQCQCGALRAVTNGEPRASYICHCQACQRRTGAIVHSGAYYARTQVQLEGASTVYVRDADSGYQVRFHFCPTCGTSLYWESDKYPTECGIAVGCFADPTFPAPTISVWEESRHLWLGLPVGIGTRLRKGMHADGRPME